MLHPPSGIALTLFFIPAGALAVVSVWLWRRAGAARGFFTAHGEIPWAINGLALAGGFLSAGSFLGILGFVAFNGYDGFLYFLGLLAGWVFALFVIAGPMQRLGGRFTFAGALGSRFDSPGLRIAAAASTFLIALLFLIPQLIAASTLLKSLLGLVPFAQGPFDGSFIAGTVLIAGICCLIVLSAGMVSTTWAQCTSGVLILVICGILAALVFCRGISPPIPARFPRILTNSQFAAQIAGTGKPIPPTGPWRNLPYFRLAMPDGSISTWRVDGQSANPPMLFWPSTFTECQTLTATRKGILINNRPQTRANDLEPTNGIRALPESFKPGVPLSPLAFLGAFPESEIMLPGAEKITETVDGQDCPTMISFPRVLGGADALTAGLSTEFMGATTPGNTRGRLDFFSLMLALFCGTAALPHLVIRHFTVKNQAAARKSAAAAIVVLAVFSILALFLGLGAMVNAPLDPTSRLLSLPLLARTFGEWPYACTAAIGILALVGTACGVLVAAAGACTPGLTPSSAITNPGERTRGDTATLASARLTAVATAAIAVILAIVLRNASVLVLESWAFTIAAAVNLPAMVGALFWKRATAQGIIASMAVGLIASLAWILLSQATFSGVYGFDPALHRLPLPFNEPAIITLPLSFLTLVIVSLLTPAKNRWKPAQDSSPDRTPR